MRRAPLIAALVVLVTPGALVAGDDPFADDGGIDVFGDAADLDPEVEARLEGHIEAARAHLDKMRFAEARRELEAADRLVPMHDEVMRLLEEVGAQEDEARTSGKLLEELERERAEKRRLEREARERAARENDAVKQVVRRHGLPTALKAAIPLLRKKLAEAEHRRSQAAREHDQCIGAAALAHAATGARRCKAAEKEVTRARRYVQDLEADLVVLESRYREEHGEDGLKALGIRN